MIAWSMRAWLAALFVATVITPVPAILHAQGVAEQGYVCKIEGRTVTEEWIPTEIVVVPDGKRAKLHDNVLKRLNRKPVRADVIESSDKRFVVSWRVPMKIDTGSTVLTFRAAIFRDSLKVNLRVNAATIWLNENGYGTCDLADKGLELK